MSAETKVEIGLDDFQSMQLENPDATLTAIRRKAREEAAPRLAELIEMVMRHEQCRGKLEITIGVEHVQPSQVQAPA